MGPARDSKSSAALVLVLVFTGAFALQFAYAEAYDYPPPRSHDEFAYLLTAETFASGRLTNPSHPMGEHFETFHVFNQPTYQAKYPPGQAAFLALGMVLFGHPLPGVWLSFALASAAIYWMLTAACPPRWALLGTVLFVLNSELFRAWGNGYWGGAVAAAGGALFCGGLFHLRERLRAVDACAIGAGVLILSNSRLFEGAVVVAMFAPLLALLVVRWLRADPARAASRAVLPLVVSLVLIAGWILFYDYTVTGDPLTLPYELWDHNTSPNPHIRAYRGSPERSVLGKLQRLLIFFVGYGLALALPFLVLRRKKPGVVYSAVVVATLAIASVLWKRAWPHYLAPACGLMVFLIIEALRALARLQVRGVRAGAFAVVLLVGWYAAHNVYKTGVQIYWGPYLEWQYDRSAVVAELDETAGEHLVIVRYSPEHSLHDEWVYNAADIDAAKIVWARDLGPERNAELFDYFAGRRIWLLEADADAPRPVPYPAP